MKKITVTTQNDTRILSITVKDEDPYVASQMADAIRVAASDHIQNVMNTEAVNVVDEANIPDEPVSPSIKKNGLIGAIAGAFIAIVIIIIVYLTNDTIQTSEDVERYLGVSTLGMIPLAEGQKKSKKKNKKRPWKKEIREDTERESGSSKTGKIRISDCGSLQISSDQPSVLRSR